MFGWGLDIKERCEVCNRDMVGIKDVSIKTEVGNKISGGILVRIVLSIMDRMESKKVG